MGEILDNTDRQTIARVILEERFFRTWYGGRTVLVGDGKRSPSVLYTNNAQSDLHGCTGGNKELTDMPFRLFARSPVLVYTACHKVIYRAA